MFQSSSSTTHVCDVAPGCRCPLPRPTGTATVRPCIEIYPICFLRSSLCTAYIAGCFRALDCLYRGTFRLCVQPLRRSPSLTFLAFIVLDTDRRGFGFEVKLGRPGDNILAEGVCLRAQNSHLLHRPLSFEEQLSEAPDDSAVEVVAAVHTCWVSFWRILLTGLFQQWTYRLTELRTIRPRPQSPSAPSVCSAAAPTLGDGWSRSQPCSHSGCWCRFQSSLARCPRRLLPLSPAIESLGYAVSSSTTTLAAPRVVSEGRFFFPATHKVLPLPSSMLDSSTGSSSSGFKTV